jgi:hypothetical protein
MSAPKLLSSQTATATGSTAPVASAAAVDGMAAGASPFDAILMLEELAASVDATGLAAGAMGPDLEGTESSDDADGEDSVEELDDPLAFLAGLIAVVPAPHSQARAPAAESGVMGAGGGDAAPLPGDSKGSGAPLLADMSANLSNTRPDAEAAARALVAQAGLTDPAPMQDEPGAPARALDFLSHAPRTAGASAVEHATVATHVRDPRWAEDFGVRIATLVNQRESVASISLTPVDLGPVDVSVTVRDSQATIHFGAAQADTRALIEASLPKLRELLAAQGFQLMDASVSQGFTQQSRRDAPSVPRPASVDEVTSVTTSASVLNGLLDTYA